jgi:hypothetical protein
MIEAVRSSETSIYFHEAARRFIPESYNLRQFKRLFSCRMTSCGKVASVKILCPYVKYDFCCIHMWTDGRTDGRGSYNKCSAPKTSSYTQEVNCWRRSVFREEKKLIYVDFLGKCHVTLVSFTWTFGRTRMEDRSVTRHRIYVDMVVDIHELTRNNAEMYVVTRIRTRDFCVQALAAAQHPPQSEYLTAVVLTSST